MKRGLARSRRLARTSRTGRQWWRPGLLGGLVLLAGCSSDDPTTDLQLYVEETQARQRPHIEPLPEVKPYNKFLYAAVADGYRSPFVPSDGGGRAVLQQRQVSSSGGPRPDLNRRREALEQFPLDALRMQGTVNLGGNQWGIVSAPDGSVYKVHVDNYVGQNHGRIQEISEEGLQVMELVPNGTGGWQWREAGLALTQ